MTGRLRRTLNVRTVLLLMALGTVVYVAALGVYALFELGPPARVLRTRAETLAQEYDSLRVRTSTLDTAFDEVQRLGFQDRLTAADRARVDTLRGTLQQAAGQSVAVQASLLLSGIPAEMRVAFADAARFESELAGILLEALQDLDTGDSEAARTWVNRAEARRQALAGQLNEAQRLGLADMAQRQRVLATRANRIIQALSLWMILGVFLAVLAALFMHRRLFAPLRQLDEGLARVAQGDLAASLPMRRQDELGRLHAHFNEMTGVLRTRPEVEALRASEVRFRSLIENSMDLISILGPDHEILYSSPAVTRTLGYGPAELVGKDGFAYLHPDDMAAVEEAFARALNGDTAEIRQEYRLRHSDGSWRVFDAVVTNLVDEPTVGGLVVNSRDITDRREAQVALQTSQENFARIFQLVPVAISLSRLEDGRFLDVNDEFVKLLGYRRDEVIGRTSGDVGIWVDPQDRAMLARVVADRGTVRDYELRLRAKDGSIRQAQGSFHGVTSENGLVLLGAFTDVTEQRQSAEALRKLEEQFRQAQRLEAVGRLAGGVAHDFNNVLTAILGFSELLLEELAPGDSKREGVEEIAGAARRAATLTRQLLAFSRRQVLQPRVLDLNTVVGALKKMLPRLLGEDIQLDLRLEPELGTVRADPGQIEQVIVNLAVNSRDAMPEGGRLTIETANVELDESYAQEHAGVTPGRFVALTVSDTGSGMDAETRTHVFEPFFTTKEHGKGTGLGLSTVHGIVSQSGGSVTVYSEPGQGTAFKVYLARVDASLEAPVGARPAEVAPGGDETVLLVEDDAGVRRVALQLLSQKGYHVLVAPDAETAMAMAHSHGGRIHLLLTDLVLPGMQGRQLADEVVATRPDTRVLFMSGYTDDAVVRHGVLDDRLPYLQKPFTARSIGAKVREILDRP